MNNIYIKDENIKLGQALKLSGAVSSGVEAKIAVQEGLVKVNDEPCLQRGKKLTENDKISYKDNDYIILKA